MIEEHNSSKKKLINQKKTNKKTNATDLCLCIKELCHTYYIGAGGTVCVPLCLRLGWSMAGSRDATHVAISLRRSVK